MEKMTMAKNFKEVDETFQELMEKVNNKLIGLDSVAISDNNAEKCKKNKDLSWYKNDNIKSPNHYISNKGFEVFDVQEAYIHDLKGMSASFWCNVVKYILRFQIKNGVEDLKKARYYLDKLIEKEVEE